MDKKMLQKYANLIAVSGVNIHKGQEVVIQCSLDQKEFIRILVEECYKRGAKDVMVLWSDPEITISHYKYKNIKDLSTLNDITNARWKHWQKSLPCRIYIESDSPDSLNKIDMKKYGEATKAVAPLIRKYRDTMDTKYQWCIACVPSIPWAEKVFPKLKGEKAVEALWDAILKVSKVKDGDANKNWINHDKNLKAKSKILNNLHLKELEYKSKNGTNFKVGLIDDVIWLGAGEKTRDSKILFQPNIPSEEIFTTPMRGKASGIVYATKPLSYRGQIIDKFWFKFEDGKVVDYDAKVGKSLIKQMLNVDKNACYLGECALIPFDSPVNNTGLLFYNTLFDENASCHIALGRGFESLLKGYEKLSRDEIYKKGINHSASHVDFMIGTKDLSIVGIDKKGKRHQIFKNGNWAI